MAAEVAKLLKAGTTQLSSFLKKQTLETYPSDTGGISYQGWSDPCPICKKDEVWQTIREFRKNPVQSTIYTFPNLESAYEWARNILAGRKAESDAIFSSPEKLSAHQHLQEEIIARQNRLRTEAENGPAAERVAILNAKYQELKQQLKAQGVFGKDKKALQQELDNCNEELLNARRHFNNGIARMEDEIAKADVELEKHKLLQIHYADECYLIRKEETIAIRLRKKEEQDKTALPVSLQPLPRIVSAEISSFDKNEPIVASALLSRLVNKNTAAKEGNQ